MELREKWKQVSEEIVVSYARFVVHWPVIWLIILISIMTFFSLIGFLTFGFPDYTEPDKGLEPRGSYVTDSWHVYALLIEMFYWEQGKVTPQPLSVAPKNVGSRPRKSYSTFNIYPPPVEFTDDLTLMKFSAAIDQDDPSCTASRFEEELTWSTISLVFERTSSSKSLLNADSLKYMCGIDQQVANFPGFSQYTFQECKSRSLANHVAFLANRPSCFDIVPEDVENFKDILSTCIPHFKEGNLIPCSDTFHCEWLHNESIPQQCWNNNIVLDTLQSLIDSSSFENTGRVKYSRVILPFAESHRSVDPSLEQINMLYDLHTSYLMDLVDVEKDGAKLVAYGLFDTKYAFFGKEILNDLVFAGIAFGLVYVLMLCHTPSIFVTTLNFLQINLSFPISYGIYMWVLRIPFFPFLNMLAVFIVIGIGADDVFVIVDAWRQYKPEGRLDIDSQTEHHANVLRRAGGSIFSTSITTSAAFLSLMTSNITAIKCFGIYCAIIVIVDFITGITFVPVVLIIHERYIKKLWEKVKCSFRKKPNQGIQELDEENVSQASYLSQNKSKSDSPDGNLTTLTCGERIFKNYVFKFVSKYYIPILIVLTAVVGSISWNIANLEITRDRTFQSYRDHHPLERYEQHLLYEFALEESIIQDNRIWARFFFGLETDRDGDILNPDDLGTLRFVPFDLTVQAQTYMADFCETVQAQPWFYDSCQDDGDPDRCRLLACKWGFFKQWVQVPCEDTTNFGQSGLNYVLNPLRNSCCNITFPIADSNTFTDCLDQFANFVPSDDQFLFNNFDSNQGDLVYMNVVVETTTPYSRIYENNIEIYNQLKSFTDRMKKQAPPGTGLDSLAFASWELLYFEFQAQLVQGAYSSAIVSMLVATAVLLYMTFSIRLTVVSLLSILCIVSIVGGLIVLIGWDLNVSESFIIGLSVGLAVDFSVHYCHTYLFSPDQTTRKARVEYMYQVMGASVTVGASTTFFSGFALSFAQSLNFYQFGVFLMILMAFSFLYSTFFLGPLLLLFGTVKADKNQVDSFDPVDSNDLKDKDNEVHVSVHESFDLKDDDKDEERPSQGTIAEKEL